MLISVSLPVIKICFQINYYVLVCQFSDMSVLQHVDLRFSNVTDDVPLQSTVITS